MSRELTRHRGNPVNDALKIEVLDEPGAGGASHIYSIDMDNGTDSQTIQFQNGMPSEVGINGITNEALLAILIDRMQGFQSGKYASDLNAEALLSLESALEAMQKRTHERVARGVEGTAKV